MATTGSLNDNNNNVVVVEKTGKIWTWPTLIRDHTRFVSILPGYLGAYIPVPVLGMGGAAGVLPSKKIEQILVTMNNSYNTCPYCTGLHGQLARMAGYVSTATAASASASGATKMDDETSDPALAFAKTFAIESGRGQDVDAAYQKLCRSSSSSTDGGLEGGYGPERARSVQSLCWALLWGKTTGNTINNARNKIFNLQLSKITSLDLFVLAYYGPLFGVIGILNICLKYMPTIPPGYSKIGNWIGAFLWLPVALHIFPLGVVSIVVCGGKVV